MIPREKVLEWVKPRLCDNASGMWCAACRAIGSYHCADPMNCGGMVSMTHHAGCAHSLKEPTDGK